MDLIDRPTLAECNRQGPLSLNELLQIAGHSLN